MELKSQKYPLQKWPSLFSIPEKEYHLIALSLQNAHNTWYGFLDNEHKELDMMKSHVCFGALPNDIYKFNLGSSQVAYVRWILEIPIWNKSELMSEIYNSYLLFVVQSFPEIFKDVSIKEIEHRRGLALEIIIPVTKHKFDFFFLANLLRLLNNYTYAPFGVYILKNLGCTLPPFNLILLSQFLIFHKITEDIVPHWRPHSEYFIFGSGLDSALYNKVNFDLEKFRELTGDFNLTTLYGDINPEYEHDSDMWDEEDMFQSNYSDIYVAIKNHYCKDALLHKETNLISYDPSTRYW